MQEDRKRKDQKDLARKFESYLKAGENFFFDEDSFIELVAFYNEGDKTSLALKAAEYGLQQYPSSCDLRAEKADVLVKLSQHQEAIEELDIALSFQPLDPELLMQKGTIYYLNTMTVIQLEMECLMINFS